MSAFVIAPETMHACVRSICATRGPGIGAGSQILSSFGGVLTYAPDAQTTIGRALFAMNVDAVRQRYPAVSNRPDDMPGWAGCHEAPMTYSCPPAVPYARRQLIGGIRALQLLRYQCAEGSVPETPLFGDLEQAIGELSEYVVQGLPEWEAASWH